MALMKVAKVVKDEPRSGPTAKAHLLLSRGVGILGGVFLLSPTTHAPFLNWDMPF